MKKPQQQQQPTFAQALFAELLGTFALTLAGAGSPMVMRLNDHTLSFTAALVAPGLLVMVMIYTLGEISGAHLNPAVTLAFAVRDDFPWRKVPGYWGAQFIGAILAALLLRALLGNRDHVGATLPDPHHALVVSLIYEIVMTLLLVLVILGSAEQSRLVGPNAALAVGATIVLDGLIGGPVTGASMNPARSFGPALVSLDLGTYWIYLIGPVMGCLLAVGCAWLLHGPPKHSERKAAQGKQQ
jgi:aquaporin Z